MHHLHKIVVFFKYLINSLINPQILNVYFISNILFRKKLKKRNLIKFIGKNY